MDAGTGSSISGNEDGATGTADSSTGSIADESEGSTDGSIESSDETTGDAGSSAGNSTEASTDGAAENEKYPEQSETVSTADGGFSTRKPASLRSLSALMKQLRGTRPLC